MPVEETVDVPAVPERLDAVHAALGRFWPAVECAVGRPVGPEERLQFATAVAEIGANIVRHAYPAGTVAGPMRLRLRLFGCSVVACYADRGVPFKPPPAAVASEHSMGELPEGGMGLAICRAGLTRLRYRRTHRGTNCWLLLKQLQLKAG